MRRSAISSKSVDASGVQSMTAGRDVVMVSVGRLPNSDGLGLEALGVVTDDTGFIRVNEKIRVREVRVIGADSEQLGVITPEEALEKAQEAGLDLVEVAANSRPPVCRIMDYGRYKYERKKKRALQQRPRSKPPKAFRGPPVTVLCSPPPSNRRNQLRLVVSAGGCETRRGCPER